MSDKMRSVPFGSLLERLACELRNQKSVFSIPYSSFYHDSGEKKVRVFSQEASNGLGPAAGPHTQLAQNIISAYLAGARFIELKTVQIMDQLEIDKPCIDARDEGYNVEWSTEFTLPKAYDEYLKAWIIVHILDMAMTEDWKSPSFIFNMSVGYNLEGIRNERMQTFIDNMIYAGEDTNFSAYVESARKAVSEGLFDGTVWEERKQAVLASLSSISRRISPSVTLSTMHGCPPAEIEAICSYMLSEKKVDTFVKLNPTLLGYETVRKTLDDLGYGYVVLSRESFEHDLQWDDAIQMLRRLVLLAQKEGRGFGVKLTNTLGNVNDGKVLPGAERYMSGRSLFPLSIQVALRLSRVFDGKLPISYSGGVSARNIRALYETGIHPVTVATDLLHPGGYLRLGQMAGLIADSSAGEKDTVDVDALSLLAEEAVGPDSPYRKDLRGEDSVKLSRPLPSLDCYVAPCVAACPIHQDIPEYVYLMSQGQYAEALAVILDKNALPNITGWICDHQCQLHCTRMDYEGAIAIRKIKKLACEMGGKEYMEEIFCAPEEPADVKAAVVGAGPAGLSAAFFLARAGFDVTLYERESSAGGVVRNVIPSFRIPEAVVDKDVDFIRKNGVKMVFNADLDAMYCEKLKEAGFDWVFYALGAEKPNMPSVTGNGRIIDATSFLKGFKAGERIVQNGHVVVIGGGNTAMDTARAAKRLGNQVTIVYRRGRNEMPCDREELDAAESEGISISTYCNPKDFTDGVITLAVMTAGPEDESGRARPVDTGEEFVLHADLLISATGEKVSSPLLSGLELERKGSYSTCGSAFVIGDSVSGPSTVVRAMASARAAVDECIDLVIGQMEAEEDECGDEHECHCHDHEEGEEHECHCHDHEDGEEHECHCHDHEDDEEEMTGEEYTEKENEYFSQLVRKKSSLVLESAADFLKGEAERCLECSYLCNKCVDVCPNRANVAIDMRDSGLFDDPFQIVHIDAYCNECGNCETFCPYDGGPYRKKFTLFSSKEDFENSSNEGFYTEGDTVVVRLDGRIRTGLINRDRELEIDLDEEHLAIISEIFISYPYLLNAVDRD